MQMMTKMDASLAKKVQKKKRSYAELDSQLRHHHLERMLAMKEASVDTHRIHMELMDALNLINIYCVEIAKKMLQSGLLVNQGQNNSHPDQEQPDDKGHSNEL